MKIFFISSLALLLIAVSVTAQSIPKKDNPIYVKPEPCYMAVEELPLVSGLRFGMKLDEIKKVHKTAKAKFIPPKSSALGPTILYEIRGAELTRSSPFKTRLSYVEFTYETEGITAISLNFRPVAKSGANALFDKITEEIGLPGNYWLTRNFADINYMQWDAACDGFSASIIIQPGFFARLSMHVSYGERLKRKPKPKEGPIG